MLDFLGKLFSHKLINHPILVVGAGRSGTSILLQSLGQHSRILSADRESPFIPYIGFLNHPFEVRENRQYHIESLNLPLSYLYDGFRRLCFESVMGKHYGLRRLASKPALMLRGLTKDQYWCAKTFPNQQECMGLIKLYPGLRIFYIFRNAYDVVESRSRFREMSKYSFEDNCRIWADHVNKYKYLLQLEQAKSVRHEEIVKDADNTFRGILKFIGLEYEDSLIKFSHSTLIHSQGKRTQTGVNVSQALKERPPAYEGWSEGQKTLFKQICSSGMDVLGYTIPF